jgi:serine/threonine protein kinase
MCKTQYKILSQKKFGEGAQGAVYLTIKGKKEFLTKNPVSKKESDISKIMSSKVGPKIYDIYECKTLEQTKNITKNGDKLKIKGRFMVMEILKGMDLDDYINEDIFIEDDAKWINILINKIKKLHKLGYYHNDLSTSNVFLIFDKINEIKDVKIIDFGKTKKITKKTDKLNDYQTLLDAINMFGSHISDKIQPLIYIIDDEIESLQKGGRNKKKIGGNLKQKVKKRPKVTFADTMTVISIPKNDCPKKNRPRLRKVKLTDTEKKEDIKYLGRARRKKYKLLCSNPNHNINTKKSGFKCCSRFKVENIKD